MWIGQMSRGWIATILVGNAGCQRSARLGIFVKLGENQGSAASDLVAWFYSYLLKTFALANCSDWLKYHLAGMFANHLNKSPFKHET